MKEKEVWKAKREIRRKRNEINIGDFGKPFPWHGILCNAPVAIRPIRQSLNKKGKHHFYKKYSDVTYIVNVGSLDNPIQAANFLNQENEDIGQPLGQL